MAIEDCKYLGALNLFHNSHSKLMKLGLTMHIANGEPYYTGIIKVFKYTPSMRMSKQITGHDIRALIETHIPELADVIHYKSDFGFTIKCATYHNHIEFVF